MSGSPARRGFVILFLSSTAVLGAGFWNVACSYTQICASPGATVQIWCTPQQPHNPHSDTGGVVRTYWFTKLDHKGEPLDLKTDEEVRGRVSYECKRKNCSLTIRDAKETDSAVYKIRFVAEQPDGTFTAQSGVHLSITEPNLSVKLLSKNHSSVTLHCASGCVLPDSPTYIWYKNGREVSSASGSEYSTSVSHSDSFSCAVKGHEAAPSPNECANGIECCFKVTYDKRRVCAFVGSNVYISCTYYNSWLIYYPSVYWFRSEGHGSNRARNLKEDDRYLNRVYYTKSKIQTVTITGLKESDSAEYRFTFQVGHFQWGPDYAGTTLTVTDLQVQVSGLSGNRTDTYAELRCHASCSPPGNFSYFWFINGRAVGPVDSKTYGGWLHVRDNVSCAVGEDPQRLRLSSRALYVPQRPSVSVSPPGGPVEGGSVTLTCSGDRNSRGSYSWYKEATTPELLGEDQELHFASILITDSGVYYCVVENELGTRTSEYKSINVKLHAMKIIRPIVAVLMPAGAAVLCLWMKKTKSQISTAGKNKGAETVEDPSPENTGD